ncbi:MAG: glycosyltransferase family 4 protein [Acinetobacter sp.]|uniref:glycosyltransferase family 4 protein n=1 Tax=Acinetobacter sp. TaxID=472 RepID=UPI00264971B9|nr:glycosyltransferase family 1 protein [Acinetobacter sp.]MDN5513312.1 glycosyltransferase family 4 protein [Acinetobacter sp.]MDN5556870.1 glycosyltransferase family 4 protein [Acinetobacter sp.]
MKIGFDARALVGKRTGIGNYIWNLLDEMANLMPEAEFIAYCPEGFTPSFPENLQSTFIRSNRTYPLMSGYAWLKWRTASLIKKDNLDVFWATRTLYPSQLIGKTPIVTTVYDLNHLICPDTMPFINMLAHKLYFKHDVVNATKVVAISTGTAERVQSLLSRHVDSIVVPGTGSEFSPRNTSEILAIRQKYNLSNPYILFIGTLEPRKNLSTLLKAFEVVRKNGFPDLDLVLVGQMGWKNQQLKNQLDQNMDGIQKLGYVHDEDLAAIYSGSEVFVLPSLYEGYGMPAAEARACGTRVIASDIPELREAGGIESIYINPLSVDDLVQGILKALSSEKPIAKDRVLWKTGAESMVRIFKEFNTP